MQKKLRLGHLLNKKSSFVYHLGKRTYKVFTPKGKYFQTAELRGNRSALKTEFWKDQVIKVEPFLFCLGMTRGEPLSFTELGKADAFIASKLEQAMVYPVQPIFRNFDYTSICTLDKLGLNLNLIAQAQEILHSVCLPSTSAHGDLHVENMICVGEDIKIIDWSMFNAAGSFITDFIHFNNFKNAVRNNESWTKSILREQPYLKELATDFNTTSNHLRLAYSITRIAGELLQEKDLTHIPTARVKKYNYVLTHIINEFGKANVQRSNTLI